MELRAIEGRATIGLYLPNGTRIATMATAPMSQWDRAQTIVTACNSHAANLARIAELESILRRVSIALQSNAITDGFTIDALNSDINAALKGTK